MKGLTQKQREVFEFIKSQIIETNRPPTIREIGKQFGMRSTGSVRDVLRALARKGFIEKDEGVSRGIRIKAGPGPLSGAIVELPVIGKIAPGTSVDSYQNVGETIKVDRSMVPEGRIIAMKVRDNAMARAGVNKGDYAFVRRQATCRAGQIVAVVLGDAVELREFSRKGDRIHLSAKGAKVKPAVLSAAGFKAAIAGVLVGVFRRF